MQMRNDKKRNKRMITDRQKRAEDTDNERFQCALGFLWKRKNEHKKKRIIILKSKHIKLKCNDDLRFLSIAFRNFYMRCLCLLISV